MFIDNHFTDEHALRSHLGLMLATSVHALTYAQNTDAILANIDAYDGILTEVETQSLPATICEFTTPDRATADDAAEWVTDQDGETTTSATILHDVNVETGAPEFRVVAQIKDTGTAALFKTFFSER